MEQSLDAFKILDTAKGHEVLEHIQKNRNGVALVVDSYDTLKGIISDYDVRDALLHNFDFNHSISEWIEHKKKHAERPFPVTVKDTDSEEAIEETIREHQVRHLPVVDEEGRLVDLIIRPVSSSKMQAVVMAGGFGKRLEPLTDNNPKPMLPVGGRPLLERTMERLRESHVQDVVITLHYMPEKIRDYFGDGKQHHMNINYVQEDFPLGTAGSLKLIDNLSSENLLVTNGDILTDLDYQSLLRHHEKNEADLTIGLIKQDIEIAYGVVEMDKWDVIGLREKPTYSYLMNTGIYVLRREIISLIPDNTKFDMTELIEVLKQKNKKVVGFPFLESWLDIGNHEQYAKANKGNPINLK